MDGFRNVASLKGARLTGDCLELLVARNTGMKVATGSSSYRRARFVIRPHDKASAFQIHLDVDCSDTTVVRTGAFRTRRAAQNTAEKRPVLPNTVPCRDPGHDEGTGGYALVGTDGMPFVDTPADLCRGAPSEKAKRHPPAAETHSKIWRIVGETIAISLMQAMAKLS